MLTMGSEPPQAVARLFAWVNGMSKCEQIELKDLSLNDRIELAPDLPASLPPTAPLTPRQARAPERPSHVVRLVGDSVSVEGPSWFTGQVGKGHDFQPCSYTQITWCDLCGEFIWGLYKQSLSCANCSYTCHFQCRPFIQLDCSIDSRLLTTDQTGVSEDTVETDTNVDVFQAVQLSANLHNVISWPLAYNSLKLTLWLSTRLLHMLSNYCHLMQESNTYTETLLLYRVRVLTKLSTVPFVNGLYLRKLSDDERPLHLRLCAGPNEKFLSLVLKENETGEVNWDAFSFPELRNFLRILQREEEEHVRQIVKRYTLARDRMKEAMASITTPG
uniref:Ras association domain family member 1 n=1 Tax=Hucho hucho TaxID=62062 RepID=A0A4W5KIR6_9TELE